MTGAEALQKIMDSIEQLQTEIQTLKASTQLIEANIKVLNNRAGSLMRDQGTSIPQPNAFEGVKINPNATQVVDTQGRGRQLGMDASNAPEATLPAPEKKASKTLTYKKVFGRLVDSNKEPIVGALVKVFDKNNEVCATAETDPIGYWEAMVQPGRYSVEYTKQGFRQVNKVFELGGNMKELEVR